MRFLREIDVADKSILLRTDYDVPLQKNFITDDSRIRVSLPTINFLIKRKVKKIIILCHLDRPSGQVVASLRVKPVAEHLKQLLPKQAPLEFEENLRFHPGEETNDLEFAESLATRGDIFINDAFASSHRQHASIVSLPKLLPSALGLHFAKEIQALDKVLHNPKKPLVLVMGGAKLKTKLPFINKFIAFADQILIGGKLAQQIGSLYSPKVKARILTASLKSGGKDITLESAKQFAQIIKKAGTIVWNGPMGVFEKEANSRGTRIIAQAVNQAPGYTVIGGGDTEAAAAKFKAESGLNHISMGGGAMLQYLADGNLPGINAIEGGKK